MAAMLFKLLPPNARSGGHLWDLPTAEAPGRWAPNMSEPCLGSRGYHLLTMAGVMGRGAALLYVAEGRGQCNMEIDGSVRAFESARLVRQVGAWTLDTLRLFAADCAERALDAVSCTDDRLRGALETARRHAEGSASAEALRAAAREAADAAVAAVVAAKRSVQSSVGCTPDAAQAVRMAVREKFDIDAAWMAADDAWGVMWVLRGIGGARKERAWQVGRLAQLLGVEPSDVR